MRLVSYRLLIVLADRLCIPVVFGYAGADADKGASAADADKADAYEGAMYLFLAFLF